MSVTTVVTVILLAAGFVLLLVFAVAAEALGGLGAALAAGHAALPLRNAPLAFLHALRRGTLRPDRAPFLAPGFGVAALATAVAAVAVAPGAIATPLGGGLGGLLTMAILRMISSLAALLAVAEDGRSATVLPTLRALPVAVLTLPALLFVAAALAIGGGSTRVGVALPAVVSGPVAPRALAAAAVALVLLAEERAGPAQGGMTGAMPGGTIGVLLDAARGLRRVALLALLAVLLPPFGIGATGTVAFLVAALPLFALKLGVLAFALGLARAFRPDGATVTERLLAGATVLGAIGAMLALVGQTLE